MKTTYSSNIAFNAIKEGKNVLYLSLEEQPLQLYCKWLSRASVDIGRPLEAQAIIHHELNDKDKAKAEKILSFDTIFNTLKDCLSGNIKLTEFLISGNKGDYFGFDFGNDIKIYLDFTKNKEISVNYLSKQYHCRRYTFRIPENN